MEVYTQYAISLASASSVGNNIFTELKIPLLVPIFPRPESQPSIYMLDDNDAVQFDDAYSENERHIINKNLGGTAKERYINCKNRYKANNITPTFKTYENVGHWTTSNINLDVIKFFMNQMKEH